MRGWASYLSLLGGRGALTPAGIAFVVSVVFSLTMLSGWGPYADPDNDGHFLPTLLAHAALAVCALLVWWLLFFLPSQPPPAVATMALFVIFAVFRIFAVDYAYIVVGVAPLPVGPARFALSIVFVVPLFALTGVLTELLQRSRRARLRINHAEESIQSFVESTASHHELTVGEVLARAQAHIDQLLLPWRVSPPTSPTAVAEEIDALVHEVIRPLSHETKLSLAAPAATEPLVSADELPTRLKDEDDDPAHIFPKDVRWREILPTGGNTLLLVALPLVGVFMWERFGFGFEMWLALLTLPLLGACFRGLRRLMIRLQPRSVALRLLMIIGGMAAAGATMTTLLVVSARAGGAEVDFVFAAPLLLAIMGTGFSIAEHLVAVTLREEQVRAQSLSALATRTAGQQGRQPGGMAEAADLLHSRVQAELVAWAALFRAPDFSPNNLPSALEDLSKRLDSFFDGTSEQEAKSAQSRFDSLITVWSAARPIASTVDSGVWAALDQDRVLADQLLLVLSEAFSNAVRHGRSGDIAVHITQPSPTTLRMSVSNPGLLARRGFAEHESLGLSTIEGNTQDYQLEQDGGRVVLTVWFSTAATATTPAEEREESGTGHSARRVEGRGGSEVRGGDDGNRTRTISLED